MIYQKPIRKQINKKELKRVEWVDVEDIAKSKKEDSEKILAN